MRAAGFTVEALVGRDPQRSQRRADWLGVARGLTSLDEALAIPGVEAVTIATPPAAHADVAIRVAEAGRHVLCEKPFALDAGEARAMLDAAEHAGVTHLVGHEFRWATEEAGDGAAEVGAVVDCAASGRAERDERGNDEAIDPPAHARAVTRAPRDGSCKHRRR